MIFSKSFNKPQVGIYVLLAGLICFVGATILALSQIWFVQLMPLKYPLKVISMVDYWYGREGAPPSLFELVITGPVFETMLLLVLLFALTTFLKNRLIICCVSAVIWGVAHALINNPANGLPSAWIFFILSYSVFDWKDDANKQYFVPLGIHSLANAMAYFLL
jgi:hypothetical protein